MLHALRFPVRHFVQDDAMTMFIGPDETGTLVEVDAPASHRVVRPFVRRRTSTSAETASATGSASARVVPRWADDTVDDEERTWTREPTGRAT